MTVARRTALVFALLGIAVVTMVVFEATITRVIGVLALFGFVIAGVFAIADHDFLTPDSDPESDGAKAVNGENTMAGTRPARES